MRSGNQIYIAGFLTWIAGFVDAVGFLAFVKIYTANMSGNSVAIGIELWNQNWTESARRLWPVVVYVVGLVLGRILLEIGARLRIGSIATAAFCMEIIALLPASFAHSLKPAQSTAGEAFGFIGLLAFAMGVQSATLTHFSRLILYTGFVTGTLVKMAEQLAKYLTWLFDELRRPRRSIVTVLRNSGGQKAFQTATLLCFDWAAYVIGAICGAAGHTAVDLRTLFVPIAGLAILALIDIRNPLAVSDEVEQATLP